MTEVTEIEESPEAQASVETQPESESEDTNPPVETTEKVQRRINAIVGKRNEEKARADRLQQQLDNLKPAEVATPNTEPSLESFDYDEAKYTKAIIDYRINEQMAKVTAKLEESQRKVSAQQETAGIRAGFEVKRQEFAAKTKDYATVVGGLKSVTFPQDTLDLIMGADNGPALAYHLGKNLDVALSISQLPTAQAAMKLGMLTSVLSPAAPGKIPSTAPDPIETIKPGGTAATGNDYENMTSEQFFAL